MIVLKSKEEVDKLRRSNAIVAEAMLEIGKCCVAGATTMDLENIANKVISKRKAKPAFSTVPGYHHTLCVSINEEVVHGIPSKKRILKDGDIVSVDCGVVLDGFFGDHAWTFPVGSVSDEAKRLLKAGEESLNAGIDKARVDNRLYDISAAIWSVVREAGFEVVRDYVGHGIGRNLHEEPQIPNYGEPNTGIKLRRGLVIAIEPMVNAGTYEVEVLSDGWTVVTKDRRPSVHFEHSIAIMDDGPLVLSRI